jgi:hypothetical protein
MRQPDIYAYLSYAPPTLRVLAYENALLCSFARHLCAALEKRSGQAPVLKLEDLLAIEIKADALLANQKNLKRIKRLEAVQFAEGGILGVHYVDGIRVVPDGKRVLLKVVALLLAFSAAVEATRILRPAHSPKSLNRQ